MTKTMKINELVSELKKHGDEPTVKVWSKGADKAYPISYLFIGSINEEDFVYINIDDRNLVDLSKIWHDASEIPEHYYKQILYQDKTGACRFTVMHDIVVMLQLKWDDFAAENISRWAYINDLLPKGGKI